MKYYLINNTIKKGVEMPNSLVYDHPNQYNGAFNQWLSSLQPCEISESEIMKIYVHLFPNLSYNKQDATPIDVTDIVEEKVTHQLLSMPPINCYELFFKQPKHGYIKCGDCNKFYLCTNCGAQCGSDGHFIEPKQVDVDLKTWYKLKNIIESELDWFEIIKSKFYIYEK